MFNGRTFLHIHIYTNLGGREKYSSNARCIVDICNACGFTRWQTRLKKYRFKTGAKLFGHQAVQNETDRCIN